MKGEVASSILAQKVIKALIGSALNNSNWHLGKTKKFWPYHSVEG
jgi:hypothetical protein